MDNLTQPFDFNPVAEDTVDDTYTVPADRYALVTINLFAEAEASQTENSPTGDANINAYHLKSDSKTISAKFWLKEGSAITKSASNATGSASLTITASETKYEGAKAKTSVEALIDGTSRLKLTAIANATMAARGTGAPSTVDFATFTGAHKMSIHYAEYKVVD